MSSGFPNRSYANRYVQPLQMASDLGSGDIVCIILCKKQVF